MKQYLTYCEKDTKDLAEKVARDLHGVIALTGELGTGKTIFVQGFAKGLGIKDKIISPSFVLIHQHKIPNTAKVLYHVDLYRVESTKDLQQLGLDEILADPDNIVLIEWAEKAKSLLPENSVRINIKRINETTRQISITNLL